MAPHDSGRVAGFDRATLTDCDREAIHTPGRIQSFGALIAVDPDWIVTHVSANVRVFLGISAVEIIGRPLGQFLTAQSLTTMKDCLQDIETPDVVDRLFGLQVTTAPDLFDVALHRSGGLTVLEFENAMPHATRDISGRVRQMIARLARDRSVTALCQLAVNEIRTLTGMDRVMAYRFEADGSGTVIAEAKAPQKETFLGLRYPASDIPKQARALYTRNLLRVIGDVGDRGIPILAAAGPDDMPLDLSLSTTRAVSPIHLEYLRNMGVGASLSVSILRRDGLWGLFACHHDTPHVPSYPMRTALELFSLLFSSQLDQSETDKEQADAARAQVLHDQIMAQLAGHGSVRDNFVSVVKAIGTVIPHDGAVGWFDGTYKAIGETPGKAHFLRLLPFLVEKGAEAVFATDRLSAIFPEASTYAGLASGMLVLPVSRGPQDYIVLFRRENVRSVQWAGDPAKSVSASAEGERISPRKSFAAWQENVAGHSDHWSAIQIRAAESLRVTLLEVVQQMADIALDHSVRAQKHQEFLIAELNHRIRNILNLIKGVVRQSSEGQDNVAAFTRVIGGRIHALALAHDQVMHQPGTAPSLYDLIGVEAAAFVSDTTKPLLITGPDALLTPAAFTTLSLVIHELLTNSVKYGALGVAEGQVTVTLGRTDDDGLSMVWRETGGPPVQAPTRRGFGTTIIERSIPYELSGKVTLTFAPAGLVLDLMMPATAIKGFATRSRPQPPAERIENAPLPSSVLVVEDNVIIGLDAEALLHGMGIRDVVVVSSVSAALDQLASRTFDFGLLDLNLGAEDSLPIAERLFAIGTGFAFTTGYGQWVNIGEHLTHIKVINKPYEEDDLMAAIQGWSHTGPNDA